MTVKINVVETGLRSLKNDLTSVLSVSKRIDKSFAKFANFKINLNSHLKQVQRLNSAVEKLNNNSKQFRSPNLGNFNRSVSTANNNVSRLVKNIRSANGKSINVNINTKSKSTGNKEQADAIKLQLQQLKLSTAMTLADDRLIISKNKIKVAVSSANDSIILSQQKVLASQQKLASSAVLSNLKIKTSREKLAASIVAANQRIINSEAQLFNIQQRGLILQQRLIITQNQAAISAIRLANAQKRQGQVLSETQQTIRNYVAALISIQTIKMGFGLADEYANLQNRIRLVTKTAADNELVLNNLFAVANRSRVPVKELTESFVRFDVVLARLGKSQQDTLDLSETLAKGLVISGAQVGETASVMLQLSQAFNAGVLKGDEFRSISENMPLLLKGVALAMNVPIDRVKKLSTQGKITVDILLKAFKLLQPEIDAQFKKTNATLSQSWTIAKNNLTQFLGGLDNTLGITKSVGKVLVLLSENMKILSVVAAVTGTALLIYFGPVLVGALVTASAAVWTFTAALLANPIGLVAVLIAGAVTAVLAFKDSILLGVDGTTTLGDLLTVVFRYAKKILLDVWGVTKLVVTWLFKWTTPMGLISQLFEKIGVQISDFIPKFLLAQAQVISKEKELGKLREAQVVAAQQDYERLKFITDTLRKLDNQIASTRLLNREKERAEKFDQINEQALSKSIKLTALEINNIKAKIAIIQTQNRVSSEMNRIYDEFNGPLTTYLDSIKALMTLEQRGLITKDHYRITVQKLGFAFVESKTYLLQFNQELSQSLELLKLDAKVREVELSLIQKRDELAKQGVSLSEKDNVNLRNRIALLITSNRRIADEDAIYKAVISTKKDYFLSSKAITRLLEAGTITVQQAATQQFILKDNYLKSTDALYEVNKALDENLSLNMLGAEFLEINTKLLEVQNDAKLKGQIIDDVFMDNLRNRLLVQKESNALIELETGIVNGQVKSIETLINTLSVLSKLQENKQITKQQVAVEVINSQLNLDLTGTKLYTDSVAELYRTMYQEIESLRAFDLISQKEADRLRTDTSIKYRNQQLDTAKSVFGNLTVLMNSENKKQFQIGQQAAIAETAINTYQSATAAYAAMARIPVVGPALGAAAAAAAIVAGLANVSAIRSQQPPGYERGGYTGNGRTNDVAGVVHGQEYVINAQSVKQFGRNNLDDINRTGRVKNSNNQRSTIEIKNILGNEVFEDFIGSKSGTKTLINVLGRERKQVLRALNL